MSSPTSAWKTAFSGDPTVDVYAIITTDVSAGTTVEMTSSPHSQLGHPRLITHISPIGPKFDPLTFKNDTKSEFNLLLAESQLARHWIATAHVLFGKRINIKLGAAELDDVADYLAIWSGVVANIEPEEGGGYNLRCKGAWHPLLTAKFRKTIIGLGDSTAIDGWYGDSHLTVIHELLASALQSDFINTTSVDPDDASNDDVGHYQIGRAIHGPHDRRVLKSVPTVNLLNQLSEIFQTPVVPAEDGKMTAIPYRPGSTAVGTFPAEHIIGASWEMGGLYDSLINESIHYMGWMGEGSGEQDQTVSGSDNAVEDLFGSKVKAEISRQNRSDYEIRYAVTDSDSQAKYRYDNDSGGNRAFSHEVMDQWTGLRGTLADEIPIGAGEDDTFRVYGGWTFAFTGGAFTGSNTERQLSASKRAILKIGGELIACKNCTQTLTEIQEEPTGGPKANDDLVSTVTVGAKVFALEFTIDERGVDGTTVAAHDPDAEVWDFTVGYDRTDKTLKRHANGAPVARFDTPILPATVEPDIGEIWTFTYDRWISEGNDGLTAAKVLITEKTWDPFNGRIQWEITLVQEWSISRSDLDFPIFPWQWTKTRQLSDYLGAGALLTPFVGEGFTVTGVGGLVATIAPGYLTASGSDGAMGRLKEARTATLLTNRDYYVYWDHYAHAVIWYPVATGAGEPALKPPNMLLLAEVIVGGSTIDTITDKRQLLGITGPSVRGFPGALHLPSVPDPRGLELDPGQFVLLPEGTIAIRHRQTFTEFVNELKDTAPLYHLGCDATSGTTEEDLSGNGNDFTYQNASNYTQAQEAGLGDGGASVLFSHDALNPDGGLKLTNLAQGGVGSLSAAILYKIPTADPAHQMTLIECKDSGGTVDFDVGWSAPAADTLRITINGNTVTSSSKRLLRSEQAQMGWRMLVVTWDGTVASNNLKVYLNGEFVTQTTHENGSPTLEFDDLGVGATFAAAFALDGYVDRAILWADEVLDADDVLALWMASRRIDTDYDRSRNTGGLGSDEARNTPMFVVQLSANSGNKSTGWTDVPFDIVIDDNWGMLEKGDPSTNAAGEFVIPEGFTGYWDFAVRLQNQSYTSASAFLVGLAIDTGAGFPSTPQEWGSYIEVTATGFGNASPFPPVYLEAGWRVKFMVWSETDTSWQLDASTSGATLCKGWGSYRGHTREYGNA